LIVAAALAFLVSAVVLRAEDWTTSDGKTYRGITVISHDTLTVTVLYQDGGAAIPLATLPPSIQKKYNFDAKAAAVLKAKEDAEAAALQAKTAALQAKAAADLKAQQDALAEEAADKAKAKAEVLQQQDVSEKKARADFDASEKADVSGQVFIVTKEKDTVNLAQIHVGLYSEDQMEAAIAALTLKAKEGETQVQSDVDAQKAACTKLQNDMDASPKGPNAKESAQKLGDAMEAYKAALLKFYSFRSQGYYISGFPAPIAKAASDADGKFTLKIPKTGSWVIEGDGQGSVDGKSEQFFWLKKVMPDEVVSAEVVLNGDNRSGVYSEGAMLSALDQPTIDDMVAGKLAEISSGSASPFEPAAVKGK